MWNRIKGNSAVETTTIQTTLFSGCSIAQSEMPDRMYLLCKFYESYFKYLSPFYNFLLSVENAFFFIKKGKYKDKLNVQCHHIKLIFLNQTHILLLRVMANKSLFYLNLFI